MDRNKFTNTAQTLKFSIKKCMANLTKYAVCCGLGHIYCRNTSWKTSFFVRYSFKKGFMCWYCILYTIPMVSSRHRRCFIKNLFLKLYKIHVGFSLGLRPATTLKKILWHRCFPVNIARFLRTPFFQHISGLLLLQDKLFIALFKPIMIHQDKWANNWIII